MRKMNYLRLILTPRTAIFAISILSLLIFLIACSTGERSNTSRNAAQENRDVFIAQDYLQSGDSLLVSPTREVDGLVIGKQLGQTSSLHLSEPDDDTAIQTYSDESYESIEYGASVEMEEAGQSGYGDVAEIDESEVWKELVHDPSAFFNFDDRLIGYFSGSNGDPLKSIELVLPERIFELHGVVYEEGIPEWAQYTLDGIIPDRDFDAPAILEDRFIFFTVYDENDREITDAIGVVENMGDPDNPVWSDMGVIVESFDELPGTPRAMDPSVLDDNGKLYLSFGSHAGGIFITELDPNTKKLLKSPDITETTLEIDRFINVAQHYEPNDEGEIEVSIEAPYLYKNDGYYYLFANWGACCSGIDSTYNLRVGRSDDIWGPYLDKDGQDMLNDGGTLFLGSEGKYIGPGHAGIVVTPEGQNIFTYHYYDSTDKGASKLAARELIWDQQGWPVLLDHLID